MKRLKPSDVYIKWTGDNATREAFNKRYTPDDELRELALKAVSESTDGINSKELIDKAYSYEYDDRDDRIIITALISGEFKRLFARCFVGAEMVAWGYDDTPTSTTIRNLDKWIAKIVKKRQFISDDIKYIIRYKIKYLLDVNELDNTTNEALRLIGFIEYFIEVFTSPKQGID